MGWQTKFYDHMYSNWAIWSHVQNEASLMLQYSKQVTLMNLLWNKFFFRACFKMFSPCWPSGYYVFWFGLIRYKYLFWYTFELQLTVFNVVPWLSTVPGIIAGGVLTRRLQSDGYSISYTRKVVEGICMITEAFCLFLIGKYSFSCSRLSIIC